MRIDGFSRRNEVYNRLLKSGNEEVTRNPELLREQLEAHFIRLPSSYGLDINLDSVEDVLLHQKLLIQAKDKRLAYHVRFLENFLTRVDETEDQDILKSSSMSKRHFNVNEGTSHSDRRTSLDDFEACSKLKDLNLDVRKKYGTRVGSSVENIIGRGGHWDPKFISGVGASPFEAPPILVALSPFSEMSSPPLLSALLSDIGLNIREAHVFSTTDGYSLDVFVVDGWPVEDPKVMLEELEKAIARSEGSWSGSSHSQSSVEKAISAQAKFEDWEIDRRLLKIGKKIASGSCGDLYRGVYLGLDVAVKVLRSEHLNDTLKKEFAQEVAILRQVQHKNVVRFIGACSKPPLLCIVTEYMSGGSLYDYLHRYHNTLKLSQLLRFAIDVCKGMEYLHQNNIIHRDLKTANLLIDEDKVVKVADFGVARVQSKEGVMTAETGTYRWMAPEVINHQAYDQRADVFSFAIVLWELATAKVPYNTMTPLQAAVGVRQGLRPEIPTDSHPKLVELMQRSWKEGPSDRPSFSDLRVQLEELLKDVNVEEDATEAAKGS
nr:serine/threonine-protein kinase STY46-like isoform X3 [Ipomoea trifida]